MLCDRKASALIDTGMNINLICERIIPKNKHVKDAKLVIRMADNKKVAIIGKVIL